MSLQKTKMELFELFKSSCPCWRWCPGKLVGCSPTSTKAVGVAGNNNPTLNQAGVNDVSVSQDCNKGAATLSGHVAAK